MLSLLSSRLLRTLSPSLRHFSSFSSSSFFVHPTIREALLNDEPVVALESTIISHGMKYPENVRTALEVEERVRDEGALPATIGILNGKIVVGMSTAEIEALGNGLLPVRKCSTRDLPFVMAKGLCGSTTVASSAFIAAKAGLSVFATGGLGGVHRGVEVTGDVSADLVQLGSLERPLLVVCSGVKSILDIPRTLEFLETQGVPVAGYQCSEFPSFFTTSSGCPVPHTLDNAREVASLLSTCREQGVGRGIVLGVPNPSPSAQDWLIEEAISTALREMGEREIQGQEVTPFLLRRVNELTEGESLRSNMALISANASLAGKVAVEFSRLEKARKEAKERGRKVPSRESGRSRDAGEGRQRGTEEGRTPSFLPVTVVGGSTVDFSAKSFEQKDIQGSSSPGVMNRSFGGVGRNIAEMVGRANREGRSPHFFSVIGDDMTGDQVIEALESAKVSTRGVVRMEGMRTPTFTSIHDVKGHLVSGIADMETMDKSDVLLASIPFEEAKDHVVQVIDGNLSERVIAACVDAWDHVWFEPTSALKATKIIPYLSKVKFISPNDLELHEITKAARIHDSPEALLSLMMDGKSVERHVFLTKGSQGVIWCYASEETGFRSVTNHISTPYHVHQVVNSTGAGDSFVGGVCVGLAEGLSMREAIDVGMRWASESCKVNVPIPEGYIDRDN